MGGGGALDTKASPTLPLWVLRGLQKATPTLKKGNKGRLGVLVLMIVAFPLTRERKLKDAKNNKWR